MTDLDLTVEIGTTPGVEPAAWTDVSALLIEEEVVSEYGRPSELSQDETGTGAFALDNMGGTWEFGIPPNTAVRVTATIGVTTYPVMYRLIESAPAMWPLSGTEAMVNVSVADAMTVLARIDLDDIARPQELSGARINALLDLADWPAGMRDIDPGIVLVDEMDEAFVNVLNVIRDTVDGEQGQMYVAPNGDFTFRDRHHRLDASAVVTFSAAAVNYTDLVSKYDDATLWTVGRAEMADGTVFEWDDPAAVDDYDRRVFPIRDLPISDAEAEMVAAWMVLRYSQPMRRFERLDVQSADDATRVAVLTLRPGDLVRVISPAVGAGDPVDELVHVERISHRFHSNVGQSTFHLSPYFGSGPWFELDHDTLGLPNGLNKLAP